MRKLRKIIKLKLRQKIKVDLEIEKEVHEKLLNDNLSNFVLNRVNIKYIVFLKITL